MQPAHKRSLRRAPSALSFATIAVAWCCLGATRALGNEASDARKPVGFERSGDRVRRAGEHFQKGYALSQAGYYERAAAEFEQAYRISPRASVLYNLGQAYAASGDPVRAARVLSQCLDADESELSGKLRAKAQAALAVARERTGWLALRAIQEGVQVHLDGRRLEAPFEQRHEVKTGTHVLVAGAVGHETQVALVEVSSRRESVLEFELQPQVIDSAAAASLQPGSASPSEVSPPNKGRRRDRQLRTVLLAGSGVALGATALAVYVAARQQHDMWLEERLALEGVATSTPGLGTRLRQHSREALSIQRRSHLAFGLGVAGTLALAAAAYVGLSGGTKNSPELKVSSTSVLIGYTAPL